MTTSPRTIRLLVSALPFVALVIAGCDRSEPPDIDSAARRFVVLGLALGKHDANYVDAYYGPDSLKVAAARDSATLTVPVIRMQAESLLVAIGDTAPASTDSLIALRHANLRGQLTAMIARAKFVEGDTLGFDAESKQLFGATPPTYADAHFDSLLTELNAVLPGREPLAIRLQHFRVTITIPAARVDTVFKRAIAECRSRTMKHITLPPGERFDLEYVKGTSWNAYNWYKGKFNSLIQVNTDLPITIDRALDLACHEGYPGHHVYNALIEETLVNGRGWVEFALYPLFSPQSLVAEGSANYGVDMAFPEPERTDFERDSLFPLAGIDKKLAATNTAVRIINTKLNYARNEVARKYLAGQLDKTAAQAAMTRYWLITPDAAAKTLRFIETYRSYVINYNFGKDAVEAWVLKNGGANIADRWTAYEALLRAPASALR